LDDRFETSIGWNVALGSWGAQPSPFRVFSSCYTDDSDGDDLPDVEEAPGVLIRDGRGLIASGEAIGPGTVNTNGTTALTGTGTTFTSTFEVSDAISIGGDVRAITAIASNTALTVSQPFSSTATGLRYFFTADPPRREPLGTTFTVADQAAMLALDAERGDFAIRSDLNGGGTKPADLFMLAGDDRSVLADWLKVPTNNPSLPVDAVKQAMGDTVSDPAEHDTDRDGFSDADELTPHRVELRFPSSTDSPCSGKPSSKCTARLITSPEWRDSDGDSASDRIEEVLGGDPTQSDRDNFADDDGDGLVNIEEFFGRVVTFNKVSQNIGWVDLPNRAWSPLLRMSAKS